MPRFLSSRPDSRLIPLPWDVPLAHWPTDYLVALPRGISRHVVRFIKVGTSVYAAKEVIEHLAIHEYRLLTELRRADTPAVEPLAVVTGRTDADGHPLDPVLITRHLEFSLPYRALFDEMHDRLTDGQREHDLMIATTNMYGEFSDLEAGRMLDPSLDPLKLVESIITRYRDLWAELTGVEKFPGSETFRIENRVRRLNALGFDVAELDITTSDDGSQIQIQPKVVDAGHHSRRLLRLTGLDTEEHQARRLLNDLDTFRARTNQTHVDEAVVAHQWLTECFQPVVTAVPPDLRGKREAAQIFHEVLDYRWYASQRQNREVPLVEATWGYIQDVLRALPDEVMSQTPISAAEDRQLANPFDPSQGFVDDEGPMPADPWEESADSAPTNPGYLDIDALRARRR